MKAFIANWNINLLQIRFLYISINMYLLFYVTFEISFPDVSYV